MKQLIIILIGIVIAAMSLVAQDIQTEPTKIESAQVPQPVITAYQENFPNMDAIEYKLMPSVLYRYQWNIIASRKLSKNIHADYYIVQLAGNGIKGKAIYDREGDLLCYSGIVKNSALPLK